VRVPGAVVELFRISEHKAPEGKVSILLRNLVSRTATNNEGEFRFRPVEPGEQHLSAQWNTPDGGYFFAAGDASVAADEDKDVGVLSPIEGHTVSVIVKLCGREHLPDESRIEDIYAVVEFGNVGQSPRGTTVPLDQAITVKVDRPFELHGLMEGTLYIGAELDVERHPEIEAPGISFKKQGKKGYPVPASSTIELVLEAAALSPLTIRPVFPEGRPPERLDVILVRLDKTEIMPLSDIKIPLNRSNPDIKGEYAVPLGDYEVWLFSDNFLNPSPQNYFGKANLTVFSKTLNQCQVPLNFGAVIKGTVLTRDGVPLKTPLSFQVEPFTDRGCAAVYTAQSNESGHFTLQGVCPGHVLRAAGFREAICAGEAQSVVHATLHGAR
jgi:hypothetical protein